METEGLVKDLERVLEKHKLKHYMLFAGDPDTGLLAALIDDIDEAGKLFFYCLDRDRDRSDELAPIFLASLCELYTTDVIVAHCRKAEAEMPTGEPRLH